MSGRVPAVDVHEADVARFYPGQQTVAHVRARAREGFNKMYGIVHPAEQWESGRPLRVSPFYQREADLGAVFFETAGWERPHWYGGNEALLSRYAGKLGERSAEWDARWWSPIINAEHLAMRESCGLVDLSAFAVFDITGPAALEAVQSLVVAQSDVRHGRVVYTSLLDAKGGFKAALPCGHRRGDRHGGEEVVHRPPAARGSAHRPDLGLDHDRRVGAAGQGRAPAGDPGRPVP